MPETNTRTLITTSIGELYIDYHKPYASRSTLVFLHDSLGCVALWRDFPQRLAEATQCNVLVYDRLGYGKSAPMLDSWRPKNYMDQEASVLNELLEMLAIEETVLFGHSDGGSIALLAASRFPERIKGVIVEAAHIFVEEVTLKGIQDAVEAYQSTNLAERLAKYHGDKVDMLFKAWTDTWRREDFRSWNIESLLPGISCPLLFIQGEQDEYGTLDQVEKTVAQSGGESSSFIIPGIGHTPHKECPGRVLEAAMAYLKKCYPPSS